MSLSLLTVELRDDRAAVQARQLARQVSEILGFDHHDGVRVATAVSELAREALRRGRNGRVEFSLVTEAPMRLEVQVKSEPVNLSPSSTASGLLPAEGAWEACGRLVDDFRVETLATGERAVRFAMHLGPAAPSPSAVVEAARRIPQLLRQELPGPSEELLRQNQELLRALAETRMAQQQLTQLNRELEDTNRGVVALYAELDERADSLKRASEAKTRFLSRMTHEFRSPLNSILSLTRMLASKMDGDLSPEQARQVGYIQGAASALASLVDDLLDLAKVEAGKVEARVTEFTAADLLGGLRGTTRPLLPVASEVALVFEEPFPATVMRSDEGKLAQVLRNLISNALKFTEVGEVRVSARELPGGRIQFVVTDTGVGIPAHELDRVFEEFAQVEGPLQARVKGTGLGLPLARQLANFLGGTLTVESVVGRGSTFRVQVPMVYPEPGDGRTPSDACAASHF